MLVHKLLVNNISIINVSQILTSITIHLPLQSILKFVFQLFYYIDLVFLIVLQNLSIKMSNSVLMLFHYFSRGFDKGI
jgi:hypothetical protein